VVRGSACRAAIWTSRKSTPASKLVVTQVAQHVRVRPGDRHPGGFGGAPQAAGGSVAVHPRAATVEQDRPANAIADCPVGRPPDRRRQRD